MTGSVDVPILVIVDHLFALVGSTPKPPLTSTSEYNNLRTTRIIRSKMPRDSKRFHRRFVSDIPNMMPSRQEQTTTSGPGSNSNEDSSRAIHDQKYSAENIEDCDEARVSTPELPLPKSHGSNGKLDLPSWFLPTGRPLAAAPKLLLARPGTAITKNDAKTKKRRRSWVDERRSREKVACEPPNNVVEASLEYEIIVDTAVTLAQLSTEQRAPMTFSPTRALPPPPFQLITNRKIGMLTYPMSFQLIASNSR